MKNLFSILLLICIFSVVVPLFGQEKKAFKLLEKKDYQSLIEFIEKETETDALNPGMHYIQSLLYSDSHFEFYNIDSAYKYVILAAKQDSLLDEKTHSRLINAGIAPIDIQYQKSRIESLAFERAKSTNTPESYNDFLNFFPLADQFTEASELRDKIAFENAARDNTFDSYLSFVKKYPEARQTPEAQSRYDNLIFKEFTRDEKLESYERFASSFPTSAHWEEAIKNIFEISTEDNNPKSYISIIKNYPHSKYSRIAASYLYLSAKDPGWIFTNQTGDFQFLDSLKTLIRLDSLTIFPVFENNAYGFIDQSGRSVIPSQFKNITPTYLCGNIKSNFLVVSNDSLKFIIARNGKVIYNQQFYNIEDIGLGLLKLSRESKYGVIHQSGIEVLPFIYSDAALTGGRFIKARTDQGWSFFTLTGKQLTTVPYDNVIDEGDFIILERSGRIAVTTSEKLFDTIIKGKSDPHFDFDDVELVDKDNILCSDGNKECIIDSQLEVRISLIQQEIFSHLDGWLVKRDSIFDIYDNNFRKISGSGLRRINYKGNWITGMNNKKWILYHNFSPVPDVFIFDSVNILDENFVFVINENKHEIISSDHLVIPLENYSGFELLSQAQVSSNENFPRYLLLKKKNQEKEIRSISGRKFFSGKFDFIQSIGDNYFLIRKNEKYGLTDSTGKNLVKPVYDGMANYQKGFITTFNGKYFGLINPERGLEIQPRFSSSPERYNDSYFIFKDGNQIGLINLKGKTSIEIVGDQINYWNDTSCLIHSANSWSIRSILTGQILYDNISSYKKSFSSGKEIYYLMEKQDYFGILSNMNGLIINFSFTDILNIGSDPQPVYFAEKYIPEADLYIVIYYTGNKKIIRKQVFSHEEYSKIYCR
jgi:hypothetical protein